MPVGGVIQSQVSQRHDVNGTQVSAGQMGERELTWPGLDDYWHRSRSGHLLVLMITAGGVG